MAKKTPPAKKNGEVVRIRLTDEKYTTLCEMAKAEKRKINNLAQVMIEEGMEKRAGKA